MFLLFIHLLEEKFNMKLHSKYSLNNLKCIVINLKLKNLFH